MMMLKFATQITYFHLFPPFQARVSNDQILGLHDYANPTLAEWQPPALHNSKKLEEIPQQLPAVHRLFSPMKYVCKARVGSY